MAQTITSNRIVGDTTGQTPDAQVQLLHLIILPLQHTKTMFTKM